MIEKNFVNINLLGRYNDLLQTPIEDLRSLILEHFRKYIGGSKGF
jgi:hypothetical protein